MCQSPEKKQQQIFTIMIAIRSSSQLTSLSNFTKFDIPDQKNKLFFLSGASFCISALVPSNKKTPNVLPSKTFSKGSLCYV